MISTKQAVTRYIISFALLLGGIIGFIIFLLFSISDLTNMDQYIVPGVHTLQLEEKGKYTIFHEHKSLVDGEYFSSNNSASAGLKIIIISENSDTIPVKSLTSGGTYSTGSREGTGVGSFKIETPGSYKLSAGFTDASSSRVVLTVTRGFGSGLVITIFASFLILGGAIALSFALAIITLVKQLTNKKKSVSSQ